MVPTRDLRKNMHTTDLYLFLCFVSSPQQAEELQMGIFNEKVSKSVRCLDFSNLFVSYLL